MLERLTIKSRTGIILAKVGLDQFVLTPVLVATFFTTQALMEGKGIEEAKRRVDTSWAPTLLKNWGLFIPVQLANFSIVPAHLRLVLVNVVSLFWNAYLSYANSASGGIDRDLIEVEKKEEVLKSEITWLNLTRGERYKVAPLCITSSSHQPNIISPRKKFVGVLVLEKMRSSTRSASLQQISTQKKSTSREGCSPYILDKKGIKTSDTSSGSDSGTSNSSSNDGKSPSATPSPHAGVRTSGGKKVDPKAPSTFNARWTPEQITKLVHLAEESKSHMHGPSGGIQWDWVAQRMDGRTAVACRERYRTTKVDAKAGEKKKGSGVAVGRKKGTTTSEKKGRFTKDEDLVIIALKNFRRESRVGWSEIGEFLARSAAACQKRWDEKLYMKVGRLERALKGGDEEEGESAEESEESEESLVVTKVVKNEDADGGRKAEKKAEKCSTSSSPPAKATKLTLSFHRRPRINSSPSPQSAKKLKSSAHQTPSFRSDASTSASNSPARTHSQAGPRLTAAQEAELEVGLQLGDRSLSAQKRSELEVSDSF
ncbi:hypothetical protein P7C70_g8260, partial [Phenoliferia sp. Uapishka_3]